MLIKEEPFYFSVAVFGPNGPSFVVSSGLGLGSAVQLFWSRGLRQVRPRTCLQIVARTSGSSPSFCILCQRPCAAPCPTCALERCMDQRRAAGLCIVLS